LWEIASTVPPEWYGGNLSDIEQLMEKLLARRERVRELIVAFRDSDREPFPNWARVARSVVPGEMPGTLEAPQVDGKWLM
jgi:hypothetical protein